MLNKLINTTLAAGLAVMASVTYAENYPSPLSLNDGAQAPIGAIAPIN